MYSIWVRLDVAALEVVPRFHWPGFSSSQVKIVGEAKLFASGPHKCFGTFAVSVRKSLKNTVQLSLDFWPYLPRILNTIEVELVWLSLDSGPLLGLVRFFLVPFSIPFAQDSKHHLDWKWWQFCDELRGVRPRFCVQHALCAWRFGLFGVIFTKV